MKTAIKPAKKSLLSQYKKMAAGGDNSLLTDKDGNILPDTGSSAWESYGKKGGGISSDAVNAGAGILDTGINLLSPKDKYGVQSNAGAIASGALKDAAIGFSVAGPIGAGAGAILGGVEGLLGNKKAQKAKGIAIRAQGVQEQQDRNARSGAEIAANPSLKYGNLQASYYAMGGTMKGTLPQVPRLKKPMAPVQPKQRVMPPVADVPGRQLSHMAKGGVVPPAYNIKHQTGPYKTYLPKVPTQNLSKMDTGGDPKTAKPVTPVRPVSNNLKSEWNRFVGFAKERGIAGSPDLDIRDKNMGKNLMDDYIKTNPNTTLRYDSIPAIQQNLQDYRQQAWNRVQQHKAESDAKSYDEFMPNLSQVDGWLGSKTSQATFPSVILNGKNMGFSDPTKSTQEQLTQKGSGGSIHIKPSHRGAFTAYKERTGKTTSEALHSSDPHVRQMANFARNAAKWHHGANGGEVFKTTDPSYKYPWMVMGANGGKLENLSAGNAKVEGPSHANGGVKFPAQGVELEGDETLNGDFVFSKKLGFAQTHEKIARAQGKVEKKPDTIVNRNTLKALDRQTDLLKQQQEATKQAMGIPNELDKGSMANGGKMKGKYSHELMHLEDTNPVKLAKGGKLYKRMAGGGDKFPLPKVTPPGVLPDLPELNTPDPGMPPITLDTAPTKQLGTLANGAASASSPGSGSSSGTGTVARKGRLIDKINTAGSAVAPFLPNLYEATRKLPLPNAPVLESEIAPALVDYSASRAEAVRQTRGANKAAEENLNTGAAVAATRAANLAQQERAVAGINEAEQTANAGIRNQTNQVNMQMRARNNSLRNQYQQELTERQIKGQELTGQNLASISEKIQGIQRDKKAEGLDEQRLMIEALKDNTGASYRGAKQLFAKHLSKEDMDYLDNHFQRISKQDKADRDAQTAVDKNLAEQAKKPTPVLDKYKTAADVLGRKSTVLTPEELKLYKQSKTSSSDLTK